MTDLTLLQSATLLTQAKIYQIDRTLYQYSHRTQSTTGLNRYHFKPLAGQRKKTALILNQEQVRRKCYETNVKSNASVISQESLQLSLFG